MSNNDRNDAIYRMAMKGAGILGESFHGEDLVGSLDEDNDDLGGFISLTEMATKRLDPKEKARRAAERKAQTAAKAKLPPPKGNPYHSGKTGHFVSLDTLKKDPDGSLSLKRHKQSKRRATGSGKNGVKWKRQPDYCGRLARAGGDDIKCSTGRAPGAGRGKTDPRSLVKNRRITGRGRAWRKGMKKAQESSQDLRFRTAFQEGQDLTWVLELPTATAEVVESGDGYDWTVYVETIAGTEEAEGYGYEESFEDACESARQYLGI